MGTFQHFKEALEHQLVQLTTLPELKTATIPVFGLDERPAQFVRREGQGQLVDLQEKIKAALL